MVVEAPLPSSVTPMDFSTQKKCSKCKTNDAVCIIPNADRRGRWNENTLVYYCQDCMHLAPRTKPEPIIRPSTMHIDTFSNSLGKDQARCPLCGCNSGAVTEEKDLDEFHLECDSCGHHDHYIRFLKNDDTDN